MVDEREDSIRQGIAPPPESEIGRAAAREKEKAAADGPEIAGGMGGTSDAETAPEESERNRALQEATSKEEP